jgi:hypothetical protein
VVLDRLCYRQRWSGKLTPAFIEPEDRLAELMTDLFGVRLVTATIARMSRSYATRLQDFVSVVRDLIAGTPVKHMDETGLRVGGKTRWLHVAATALLTFYRVCQKRGSLLANVVRTVVHDHWKPYYTMTGVCHALCNAHHLRELKALIDIEKEEWARAMHQLLRRACHAANLAAERGGALATLKPRLVAQLERRYDAIVTAGLAFHQAQPALRHAAVTGARRLRGRTPRRTLLNCTDSRAGLGRACTPAARTLKPDAGRNSSSARRHTLAPQNAHFTWPCLLSLSLTSSKCIACHGIARAPRPLRSGAATSSTAMFGSHVHAKRSKLSTALTRRSNGSLNGCAIRNRSGT